MDDKKEGPGTYFFVATGKMYEGEWALGIAKVGPSCIYIYRERYVSVYLERYRERDSHAHRSLHPAWQCH